MSSLHELLDEMTKVTFNRKVSRTQTQECPVWNQIERLWMESDAQLRERIKRGLR